MLLLETPPATTTVRTEPPRLDGNSNGMLMTPEEFDAVEEYDENWRYELVHGVVVVSPIPNESHESPGDQLGFLLRDYQRRHPNGKVIDATLPNRYIRTATGRRIADRVIWVGLGRRPRPKRDIPAIAVEFVSKAGRDRHRDYVVKRGEYRAVGVQEYWIIDRFDRTMTVCFADGTHRVVEESTRYTTPLLPGFELPLGELMAIADWWDEAEEEE